MDQPERIEAALAALVFRRSARAAWRAHGPAALGLDEGEHAELARLDPDLVERTAAAARRQVLSRRHRGSGGLEDWYPRTLASWRERHPDDADLDELAARLLDGTHGAAWRETAGAGSGLSLEEAFYRFAEETEIGAPSVREEELLAALARALAVTPEPDFVVPSRFRRAPAGWFAVAGTAPPILHAAAWGRVLSGPITPLLATLLEGAPLDVAAGAHRIPIDAARAARAALEALGLLAAS